MTITGINTVTNGALVLATWASTDDNTWALQTAGWANAGGTQYRNQDGTDASQSAAYRVMPTAGATGNVTNRQTVNGGDAGNRAIIAFREVQATYYTRASTAWNTGTTWSVAGCGGASAGTVPVAGADVVICNGHTVPLDTSTPNLASVTIQGTGILNIGNDATARTLTVTGNVDNAGTLQYATAAAHAVNIGGAFTNGGTFTSAAVAGAKTLAVTGLITNSGTFRFAGTAAMTVTATGGITNSSTFDVSAASNVTHTLNIAGNLTNSGTVQLAPDVDSLVNTTFNGTVQTVGGTAGATFNNVTTTGTTVVTVAQPQVFSGTLTLGSGTTFNAGALSHTIAGDFTNNGATFNPSTGTFTFNRAGAQAIGGSTGTTFNNLVTASTAAVTVSQPLTISGNLTLGAGTTFNAGALSHTIAGNFSNNGATFNASTGTFTFNGAGAQAIGGSTGTTFRNLATANTAAVTVAQPLTISGNLTLGNATTFSAGASSHSIAGNFTNNGATFSSTGLFTFNGGSAQVIGGTTASTFNNLTINSAGVTLSGVNATAGGVLTLTSGVVTTGANVLVVTGNCPGSVVRTAGHVAGFLRLRVPAGSPTCVFPIGDAAGYRPVTAAFTTVSVAGDVTAVVTQGCGRASEHRDFDHRSGHRRQSLLDTGELRHHVHFGSGDLQLPGRRRGCRRRSAGFCRRALRCRCLDLSGQYIQREQCAGHRADQRHAGRRFRVRREFRAGAVFALAHGPGGRLERHRR